MPELAACCRFERRDVFDGAPDEPVDMVSCRNLLIYLKPEWQTRLVTLMHRALRPEGLLLLSPVETLGSEGEWLFAPVNRDQHLYRKRVAGHPVARMEQDLS